MLSTGRDYLNRLYLKIPENFVLLILPDGFQVALIIIIIIIIITLHVSFYTGKGWWALTGIQVTESLFRFPGLILVFYPSLSNSSHSMVLILPLISNFSISFSKILGDRFVHTNSNCYYLVLYIQQFFSSQGRFKYLSIFLLCFILTLCSNGMAKPSRQQILFFVIN